MEKVGEQLGGRLGKGETCVAEAGGIELPHEFDGGEHILHIGARTVAVGTEDNVDAELPPH